MDVDLNMLNEIGLVYQRKYRRSSSYIEIIVKEVTRIVKHVTNGSESFFGASNQDHPPDGRALSGHLTQSVSHGCGTNNSRGFDQLKLTDNFLYKRIPSKRGIRKPFN